MGLHYYVLILLLIASAVNILLDLKEEGRITSNSHYPLMLAVLLSIGIIIIQIEDIINVFFPEFFNFKRFDK